ncbi:MAG: hypothetical protein QHH30_02015 [candidate division NC10 bacterium]|nr:hypothetical protein [candidate division NC10 bacterium]
MIIDGSPGIGCPVIASVAGSDLVLIVTEPSLSAQHDMERVVELARHFRTPLALCINRFDLNEEITEGILDWCKRNEIRVAGVIPYDHGFTRAQMRHMSLMEYSGGRTAEAVRSLWRQLVEHLA